MTATTSQILIPKFRDDCLLSQGIEIGDLIKVRKDTVMFVHPCSSERGKLMADIELTKESDNFIDPETLCSLLEAHRRRFAEIRCSPKLGVAKLVWRGREISIFKNGKLKIQRALDRDEIMRVAGSISRLIWGAAICRVCGQPTLNCASGKCGKCSTGDNVSLNLDNVQNAELLREAYSNLEKAKALFPERSEVFLKKARYLALYYTIESQRKEDAALGIIILGETDRLK